MAPHGYETAAIQKKPDSDFNFCKTANRAYDVYVVAFFHIINALGLADFSSDGDQQDLLQGRALGDLILRSHSAVNFNPASNGENKQITPAVYRETLDLELLK